MVQSSCSPISSIVSWYWCCVATTTSYLLMVGSDWVFGVDASSLFLVIVQPPSCSVITPATTSFLLVLFSFLGADV